jgi:hypothetical protein
MATFKTSGIAILFTLVIVSGNIKALSVVEVSEEQLTNKAEVIVIGKVLSAYTEKEERSGDIVTFITVRVTDQIKGKHRSEEITVKTFGGRSGEDAMFFPGAADFFRNEEVLLFLERGSDQNLMPIGFMLGKYSIYRDSQTGKKIVLRHTDGNGQYFSAPREEKIYVDPDKRMFLSDFRARIEKIVGSRR